MNATFLLRRPSLSEAPRFLTGLAAFFALGLAACDTPGGSTGIVDLEPVGAHAPASPLASGAVYTATNDVEGNTVLVFPRHSDGTLGAAMPVATGGLGTGGGLGNQGGVVLSDNGRWLLVVNAGSDDVSLFRITHDGLELADVQPSGGAQPVSIAVRGSLVYVLNAGEPNNVSGFRLRNGALEPIPGSARSLSAASTAPAQVQFDPTGRVLVVTEKATDLITTFQVQPGTGMLDAGRSRATPGATPFGFDFTRNGTLIVSEAFGGAPGASALSSFSVAADAGLTVISPVVTSGETAACWIAITRDGRLAFTTNTASGTVSAYHIGPHGTLTLANAVAANTGGGSSPIDMSISGNGRFAYVLAVGNGTLRPYTIEKDGTLTGIGPVDGLPGSANGLAVR